jgi:hypothetical protein
MYTSEDYYRILKDNLYKRIDSTLEACDARIIRLIRQNEKEFLAKLYEPYVLPDFSQDFIDEIVQTRNYNGQYDLYHLYFDEDPQHKIYASVTIHKPHPFQGSSLIYPYHKLKQLSFFPELRNDCLLHFILTEGGRHVHNYITDTKYKYPVFRQFLRHNMCFVPYIKSHYKASLPKPGKQLTPPHILTFLNQLNMMP